MTDSGVEGGGVTAAGVVEALALLVGATVDPDSASRSELMVARGAQHRVRRGGSSQGARSH